MKPWSQRRIAHGVSNYQTEYRYVLTAFSSLLLFPSQVREGRSDLSIAVCFTALPAVNLSASMISDQDLQFVKESLLASEDAKVKIFYLNYTPPHHPPFSSSETSADTLSTTSLRELLRLGDESAPWCLAKLLRAGRVISCDARCLWEHIGRDFLERFDDVGDLWTEQKAVKWVRLFLLEKYSKEVVDQPLYAALLRHIEQTVKPPPPTAAETQEEELAPPGVMCSAADTGNNLPPVTKFQATEIVPMRGLDEGSLRCAAPLAAFHPLLRIPTSQLFNRETVRQYSALGKVLARREDLRAAVDSEEALLVITLLYERYVVGAVGSHWRDILQRCPASYPFVPTFWDVRDLYLLDGLDMLDEAVQRREELLQFHGNMVPLLPLLYDALLEEHEGSSWITFAEFQDVFSVDHLQWGRATFDSRAFHIQLHGETVLTMVPWADMINHSNHSDVLLRHVVPADSNDNEECFVMEVGAALSEGAGDVGRELVMSYGPLQNWELLQYYGFVLPVNSYDTLPFPLEFGNGAQSSSDADSNEESRLEKETEEAAWTERRRALSDKFSLFSVGRCWVPHSGVPPDGLIALLRIEFATVKEMEAMESGSEDPFSPLSVTTEATVLAALVETVNCVIDVCVPSEEEEEENEGAESSADSSDDSNEDSDGDDEDEDFVRTIREGYAVTLKLSLQGIARRTLEWCQHHELVSNESQE